MLFRMVAPPLAASSSPAEIARASGSNFLLSFAFLSPGRRRALLAVYAFCRVVDDAVDLVEDPSQAELAREHLEFWKDELEKAFEGRPGTPTGFALHRAAECFALEQAPLMEVCHGVGMDLEPPRYASFEDLELYMSRVASAVGITCLPIFGADKDRARPYAHALGLALQYTNILRDIAEDGDHGRVYLPRDELARHGVDPAWLCGSPLPEALAPDGPVARLLRAEIQRARGLYEKAAALLPAEDRRALKPARIMGRIYRDLLDKVEGLGPASLTSPRVRCPLWRKLYLALFSLS